MKPLELNILFFSDENTKLNEILGKEDDDNIDFVVDKMTFYHINAVSPNMEDDEHNNYSTIYADGDEFICTDSYEVVKSKIAKAYGFES